MPMLLLWLFWDKKKSYGNLLEIKKKKIEIRLFNTSHRMQYYSSVLPEHLWPFCGSLASWGETTGSIYWQAESRKNTISWQKTSHPEQTSFLHRHTQPHTCMASSSSLFISAPLRKCPHLQHWSTSGACRQYSCMSLPCVEFLSACGSLPHRREKAWSPVSCSVCSEEEHAFLKFKPEHTAVLFLFLLISQGCGGLSGPGGKTTEKKSKKNNGGMVVF